MVALRTAPPVDNKPVRFRAAFVAPPDIGLSFPFGFSQIVSTARAHGGHVGLVDLIGMAYSPELRQKAVDEVIAFQPDVLCLTGFTNNYTFIKEVAAQVREAFPNVLIVGGGYWSWWCPEFAVRTTEVDIVVNGEGEVTFGKLMDAWPDREAMEALRGITFKKPDGTIVNNGASEQVNSLETLPGPEYDLFDYGNRYILRKGGGKAVHARMQTGRGCIAKCTFCTGPGQAWRRMPFQRLIDDMRYHKEKWGVTHIKFKETLTVVPNQRTKDMLAAFRDSGLGIKFHMVARIDALTEEMVSLMKEAGCESIAVGIESFDEHMLNSIMKKKINPDQIVSAIEICHRYGIHVTSGFIIGMPGETLGSIWRTALFALRTPLTLAAVYFPVPYPGTELYNHTRQVLGLSEDEILGDENINTGRNLITCPYSEAVRYLRKYRYTDISPHVLIFAIRMINRVFVASSYLAKNDRKAYLYRMMRLFSVDPLYELGRIGWGMVKSVFVKEQAYRPSHAGIGDSC